MTSHLLDGHNGAGDSSAAGGATDAIASMPLLHGAPPFRDLGGLPTMDGRRLRCGRVFRSCGLMELTDADVQVLRDAIGLKTVIDLRHVSEVTDDGHGPLAGLALHYRNLPLIDLIANPSTQRSSLVDRYRQFLDGGASAIAEVVALVADPAWQPAVFHCTAGKDRTGVVAAILLAALGVRTDAIVADYSAQRSEREWLRSFLTRRRVQGPRLEEMPPDLLDCNPDTMREFLRILDADYGGARQFLLTAGADKDLPSRLEATLLDPPQEPIDTKDARA